MVGIGKKVKSNTIEGMCFKKLKKHYSVLRPLGTKGERQKLWTT